MPSSKNALLAGCAGGVAQVLAGQPFDMVKVRFQAANSASNKYSSIKDCVTKIIKNEGGLRALWRGSLPPIMSVGAAVSIQFGVNEQSRAIIKKLRGLSKLSVLHYFQCGVVAGLATSIISIPTEHSRIRMQIQNSTCSKLYGSSMECIKKIVQQYGYKGLYKGGVPTVLREGVSFGIYFAFYEWITNKLVKRDQMRQNLDMLKVALCGGITGVVVWLATFPIDVIKTRIQADSFMNPTYKGMMDCARTTLKGEGFKGFYKGFSPCLLRAIPANGATFLAYETAFQVLTRVEGRAL
jgi:solute carrier family 25 carnitine/acylcarnitine transporter 20/29